MNTKRSMITTVLAAALLVSMAGMAFAGSSNDIWATPTTQYISFGAVGTYTIHVNTSHTGEHSIEFDTMNPDILANLTGNGVNTGAAAQTGNDTWTADAPGGYTFTYSVYPQSGGNLVCNTDYPMRISDGYPYGSMGTKIYATVIISTAPIPELPTFALVGIGLVGMVALGRRKKR